MRDVCTDAEMLDLIQRARKLDEAAFERLYNMYADKLYRYILARVGDTSTAEDLTAEVFLRVLRRIERFQPDPQHPVATFSGWIYRIAANLVTDHFRSRSRHETVPLDIQPPHRFLSNTSEDIAAAVDRQDMISRALAQLTEDQRLVILCKFGEGMSNRETAAVLGKTEGAVKSLQHRALATLQRILSAESS
ncbi:MAG: sigma-70 family RNA polymerase sigma factor [Chloroflexi bacterium]|nr:sigma-70 family RNA polymerase sigma factor [Chloroflexota bacterium]